MDFLVHHFLKVAARKFPHKEALIYGKDRLTYSNTYELVLKLAQGLRQGGLQQCDRVGIYLEPGIDQAIAIFGVLAAGGVFVPINSTLMREQVKHIIQDCQMVGFITTGEKFSYLNGPEKIFDSFHFLVLDSKGAEKNLENSYLFLSDIYDAESFDTWEDWGIGLDLAGILYTSGSTGKPKGVMVSHAQLMSGSSIVSQYLEITEKDKILAVLPFNFDAGLNQLMTAFEQGATLVILSFVFAKDIVKVLVREEITGLAGVPTLWNLLAQDKSGLSKAVLPSFRYLTNTGGVMPQPVLHMLRNTLPNTKIFLMYGLTEAFRSTYLPPEELDRRPTSMGKAIPNTEIFVLNSDGELCEPGEVGELVHRGPTVSLGYWGKPELTEKVLRPNPLTSSEIGGGERVCYSGDLVKMDKEGYCYFVGRRDSMIKTSGYRVSRTEIEEVFYQQGQVKEAAVIGVPDVVLGQSIKAVLVIQDENSASIPDLLMHCAKHLPRYMVPKSIELVEALPKTPNGKIDYPALEK